MKQLAKIWTDRGTYTIVYDDRERYNRCKVYLKTYGTDGKQHKTLQVKYADYRSCMLYIAERV